MESNTKYNAYQKAEKKVKRIKFFYNHLQKFVIMMLILLLFSNTIIDFFESYTDNIHTLQWVRANIWVNVFLWFIGLSIHGLFAFKNKINFIDKWENSKVEELMDVKD